MDEVGLEYQTVTCNKLYADVKSEKVTPEFGMNAAIGNAYLFEPLNQLTLVFCFLGYCRGIAWH